MPRIILCALVAAAVISFGCHSGSSRPGMVEMTATASPAASIVVKASAPIIIGVSAPLNGDQSALGTDIADAAELAIDDRGGSVRGHLVKIQRMDDGCSDAEKSVSVARSLSSVSGLAGVVGPMCTTGAQAADVAYERADIVHILPAATRSDLSQQGEQYLFRTAWRDDAQAVVQAAYATQDLALTNAVLIDDGDPYGKTLADAFASAFGEAGGNITSRERVERGTKDFSAIARQVKNSDPPLVVFEGLNPEGSLTLKALREAGFTGTFMAPDGVLNNQTLSGVSNSITEGMIITGGASPDLAFIARFHNRFQRDPVTSFVLQSYDAVSALIDAINTAATDRSDGALVLDREGLGRELHQQKSAGLTGSVQFDEQGDRAGDTPAELGITIYRVMSGRFEAVR